MRRQLLLLGGKKLVLGERTLIMGIVNITPDSFSDGGEYNTIEGAVVRAKQMVQDGADILDIGGESTRPGADYVSEEEELKRVIPVIRAIAREVDIPISIDTYKAEVARQALEAGAHIINDIWGFKQNQDIAGVAAAYKCPVILMHNRKSPDYGDFMADVKMELLESIRIALEAGVANDRIILDPGIGFAKEQHHNLYLLQQLPEIVELGYPVLLGTSRKRVIRNVLHLPPDQVALGTAATVALGIASGAAIMRVHDVLPMKQAALMADAVLQARL
ncbi:MAG: sul [Paenibacillaceae bacterium]|jgi:dihydropteroate synthase|nr:sul [Paenibacillaceae bacterium]